MKIMQYHRIYCRKPQKSSEKIFAILTLLWYNIMVYISVIIPYTIFKWRQNSCLKTGKFRNVFR